MRIVLVDDDPMVLETITLGWPEPADEFNVFDSFNALKPFLFSPRFLSTDCVILDLQLPDASGSQILTEIRKLSDVPIIMLSGWGDTDFRADLINRGIDDYVLKPTSAKELHARASRLVRRLPPQANDGKDAIVQIGNVDYLATDHILKRGTNHTELTHAEARLLDTLIAAAGKPVGRDDLYLHAFGRPYKDGEKVLETYVSRLRHKLDGLEPGTGHALQTARGIGYRIVAKTP
jgi:DNA-binding response OmpR family regulator